MHWHMGRRVLEAETPPGLARTLRVAAFTAVALVGRAINPNRRERYWYARCSRAFISVRPASLRACW